MLRLQAASGMGAEEAQMVVESMAQSGVEPTYCMGDDIPLAVLSDKSHVLYNYFKQRFAQVNRGGGLRWRGPTLEGGDREVHTERVCVGGGLLPGWGGEGSGGSCWEGGCYCCLVGHVCSLVAAPSPSWWVICAASPPPPPPLVVPPSLPPIIGPSPLPPRCSSTSLISRA